MECEDVSKRLWEYLDKELDPVESTSVTEHLLWCSWCRRAHCCGRALLDLVARQREACKAPRGLVIRMRRLANL